MKFLKKFIKWFLIVFTLLIAFLYIFDYDYLIKAVRTVYLQGHITAFLDDYKEFDNRIIEKGNSIDKWPEHKAYNKIEPTEELNNLHDKYNTVAFLIIKNDSIWHEKYYDGFNKDSKSNSFSMAKTMVSSLLGRAIMDGDIKSLNQPVADFFPEFSDKLGSKLTVGDLSSMSSGLNWDENYYSPFSITTRAYFDDDLRTMMLNLKVVNEPGTSLEYLSGNTQLLGMVIEKATGKTLSENLSEKFWKPLGCENPALWQLDSEEGGLEKAYCCIASNARDFARFGRLYKCKGYWNGKKLLEPEFVELSTRPRFQETPYYGYGLWLSQHKDKDIYYLRGHLGQYVIVIPEDDLIIVRLGEGTHIVGVKAHGSDLFGYIDETYKMLAHAQ